jgi:hypothetical protein
VLEEGAPSLPVQVLHTPPTSDQGAGIPDAQGLVEHADGDAAARSAGDEAPAPADPPAAVVPGGTGPVSDVDSPSVADALHEPDRG